jgi:hypothetical protein
LTAGAVAAAAWTRGQALAPDEAAAYPLSEEAGQAQPSHDRTSQYEQPLPRHFTTFYTAYSSLNTGEAFRMADTAKVMISLPRDFLAAIDRLAEEEHRTRSELLREAARQYIAARHVRRPIDRPEVRRAIATMDRLAAQTRPSAEWDAVTVVRRDRKRDRPARRRA